MEQTPGYLVLSCHSLVANIASSYTAFLSDQVAFSSLSWSVSAASQRTWGTRGLAGSGAAFVCDQDCFSARALPSTNNEPETPRSSLKIRDSLVRESDLSLQTGIEYSSFIVNNHGEAEWINKVARGEIKTKWHMRYE